MNTSRFKLVHQPDASPGGEKAVEQERLFRVQMGRPSLARSLESLRPELKRVLLNTTFAPPSQAGELAALDGLLNRMTEDVPAVTVGVWDIDAFIPRRGAMIEALNRAQAAFVFFEVFAAVPAGLVTPPERVKAWAK